MDKTEQALGAYLASGENGGSPNSFESDVLLVRCCIGATASAGESDVDLSESEYTKNVLHKIKEGRGKLSSETMSLVVGTCSNTLDGLKVAADAAAVDNIDLDPAQMQALGNSTVVAHKKLNSVLL